MQFSISRHSDCYRVTDLPTPDVKPHPRALWDAQREDWMINVLNLEQLLDLIADPKTRVIIDRFQDGPAHIEIDDITFNHKHSEL